jgi:hypothetical protein
MWLITVFDEDGVSLDFRTGNPMLFFVYDLPMRET